MKIFQVGSGNKKRKTEYLVKNAFQQLGHQVYTFDDKQVYSFIRGLVNPYFLYKLNRQNPDLVLFSKAEKLNLNSIKKACKKYPAAMWYFDANIPFKNDILERAKLVDIFFLTNKSQASELKKKGVSRAVFLPQACGLEYDLAENLTKKYEVSFIGNNNSNSKNFRTELLLKISKHFNLHIWGRGWSKYDEHFDFKDQMVYNREYARICKQSKVLIDCRSYDSLSDLEGYFSNRVWMTLGYGGFLISQYNPAMQKFFDHGKHLVFFKNIPEAIEAIEYYLNNEEERKLIAQQARKYVRNNHNYVKRVKKILEQFEGAST